MMSHFNLAAAGGRQYSNLITEALGVIAVCSFVGIAVYILAIVIRDAKRRRLAARMAFSRPTEQPVSPRYPSAEQRSFMERERIEERFAAQFDSIQRDAAVALQKLVGSAALAFEELGHRYATNSYGLEGETLKTRAARYALVCERQWLWFKGDLAFLSFDDIQENLRHILTNHHLLNAQTSLAESLGRDVKPEQLRSQELVSLARVVRKEKVRNLQAAISGVVETFRDEYQTGLRPALNDQLVKVTMALRKKTPQSISLSETQCAEQFKQLKTRLDLVIRLSDYLSQSTQKLGGDSLVLSQLIYVGTIFSLLESLPEWATEFGISTKSLEPEEALSA